jgi:hypothetical protein
VAVFFFALSVLTSLSFPSPLVLSSIPVQLYAEVSLFKTIVAGETIQRFLLWIMQ